MSREHFEQTKPTPADICFAFASYKPFPIERYDRERVVIYGIVSAIFNLARDRDLVRDLSDYSCVLRARASEKTGTKRAARILFSGESRGIVTRNER